MKPWTGRSAGVLLHAASLPRGDFEKQALRFAAFLERAGVSVWQTLPVGIPDAHGSPYQPSSAFAGDAELFGAPPVAAAADALERFSGENADWLPDYALFTALEQRYAGLDWAGWPPPLRDREPGALRRARHELREDIARTTLAQFSFARRWQALKQAFNDRGIRIFGDVPLCMAHHSADVWAHRELFEVGDDGQCQAFMGVPPDAFAADGQWWGYPPYRWDRMAAEGFRWWKRRFAVQAQRFDLVRIDHFRGLEAFWRIPRDAATAREGVWRPGPGRASLDALHEALHGAQLVAEDLGHITEAVVRLRRDAGIPGMRILQFAFDGHADNPHLPHHHEPDTVCYTGTHDNDTTLGWWNALDGDSRRRAADYLRQPHPRMPQALVECAWASPAPLAIVPMQDLLGLGSEARMNRPGLLHGNWAWRFEWDALPADLAERLRADLERHGRARRP